MIERRRPITNDAHGFVQTFAVVLCVAAVTTVLFQRLKQPVVLGYLRAGLASPIPILAIQRGKQSVLIPPGHERLEAGDILALAGTNRDVEAAQQLLLNDGETRAQPIPAG